MVELYFAIKLAGYIKRIIMHHDIEYVTQTHFQLLFFKDVILMSMSETSCKIPVTLPSVALMPVSPINTNQRLTSIYNNLLCFSNDSMGQCLR